MPSTPTQHLAPSIQGSNGPTVHSTPCSSRDSRILFSIIRMTVSKSLLWLPSRKCKVLLQEFKHIALNSSLSTRSSELRHVGQEFVIQEEGLNLWPSAALKRTQPVPSSWEWVKTTGSNTKCLTAKPHKQALRWGGEKSTWSVLSQLSWKSSSQDSSRSRRGQARGQSPALYQGQVDKLPPTGHTASLFAAHLFLCGW